MDARHVARYLALTIALGLSAGYLAAWPQPQGGDHPPCYSKEGADVRCADGKFHGPDGKVQPEVCDNSSSKNSKTLMHNCQCERAVSAKCEENAQMEPGSKCGTYCRKETCACASKGCS